MWPLKQTIDSIPEVPEPPAAPETSTPAPVVVSTAQLAEWRRHIVQFVSSLERERRPEEGLAARISRLSRDGVIPRQIAGMMRTVTEMRNAAEYESKIFSTVESSAVSAAYAAVKEWAATTAIPFGERS